MTHEFEGKKYEKASAHQKEWGTKLIAELDLQGTERILDLGCGDGALSAYIADLVPHGEVVGIDASRGMIEAARSKVRKNLRFLLMDINELNDVGQFDVVFSNATLHWVKDHRRLLRSVDRALLGGGRLRFNFAGEGNCSHFFSVIREAMSAEEFAVHFAGFDWPWYMPSVEEYSIDECFADLTGMRRVLHLSQEEFALRYHIPIGTLRDWELGRCEPDPIAKAYLHVIAYNPDGVVAALNSPVPPMKPDRP